MNTSPPPVSYKLSQLPLRPSTLSTLERRGFASTGEFFEAASSGVSNLASELNCSLSQAASYMREVHSAIASSSQQTQSTTTTNETTALSLLSKLSSSNSSSSAAHHRTIVTFSKAVDSMLGGGIAKGEVTECVGLPGVGKTQCCMQLCVDARLPAAFGGVQGGAVYIDTEGSFSPERCFTMAKALVEHIHGTVKRRKKSNAHHHVPEWFTAERILDGIHVYRVHDEASQTATIYSLPSFLRQQTDAGKPVRLVVIDSIAFHYRCAPPGSDYMARTRSLTNIAAFLADIATQFDVAVVVVNQMTTKVGGGDRKTSTTTTTTSKLVPALGESWAHATTTRILLSQPTGGHDPSIRRCTLVKSPHKAAGSALFQVRETGIRDVPPTTANQHLPPAAGASVHSSKRPRMMVK